MSASELRLQQLMAKAAACPHGLRCYRKNPAHFTEFSHPPGHPMNQAASQPSTASEEKGISYPSAVLTNEEKERREIALIKGALTSKRGWHGKLFDDAIVDQWRIEAKAQCSIHLFEQAVLELRSHDYVNRHGIAYVDNLVPSVLRNQLAHYLDAIAKREPKDFHPFSNDTVQNLIHPALFPLVHSPLTVKVGEAPKPSKKRGRNGKSLKMTKATSYYGVTQPEDSSGDEDGVPVDPEIFKQLSTRTTKGTRGKQIRTNAPNEDDEEDRDSWTAREPLDPLWHCVVGDDEDSCYQWLPAEVSMKANGKLQFDSYINNLAPSDYELVSPLTNLFQTFLPKLEEVIQHPSGEPHYSLRNKKLQVIVKAANYVLKPGQTYEGGWHVEGVPSEHIVATALFYYDTTPNMQGGTLSFRRLRNLNAFGMTPADVRSVSGDQSYQPEDKPGWDVDLGIPGTRGTLANGFPEHKFHFASGGASSDSSRFVWAVRDRLESTPNHVAVDSVPTLQGRCLFFKNSLQHKVERLYNISSTETATRKILLFWLIHPEQRIVSTMDVPMQQFDRFVAPALKPLLAAHLRADTVADIVLAFAREGMTEEEARMHRLGLMQERKFVSKKVTNQYELMIEREYSFCEH